MTFMENTLLVSPSPHDHSKDSVRRNMYYVLLALLPAFLVSLCSFGLGALLVTLVSVASCLLFEWSIQRFLLKRDPDSVMDGSAILTGVLLAFNLPSSIPLWMVILGALFAIGVGKMCFGGLGNNPLNPALLGRVFLLISFPVQMTSWPLPGQWTALSDAATGATPLAVMKASIYHSSNMSLSDLPSLGDTLLGLNLGGSLGEISALALILGGLWLLIKKVITWHIPVSILLTVAVISTVAYLIDPLTYPSPEYHLLTGGLMLGAFFMATDYVTSPMCAKGQVIYGVLIGSLTMVIRLFGAYPEGMSFAILIMNAFTPLINNYVKPQRFSQRAK